MNEKSTEVTTNQAYHLSRVEKDFESYIQSFLGAVRIISVINGGGAVALLTFLSNMVTAENLKTPLNIETIISSLVVAITMLGK